jgi:hypothetical protein
MSCFHLQICWIPRHRNDQSETKDNGLYDRCFGQNLLSNRAWCFQERYLARHTLHFTKELIFCECRAQTASEAWRERLPISMTASSRHQFPTDRDTMDAWLSTVALYSTAKLSFPSDKLVAISGVARHIQSKIQYEYIAGLWRTNLEVQLCWRVVSTLDSHRLFASPFSYALPTDFDVQMSNVTKSPVSQVTRADGIFHSLREQFLPVDTQVTSSPFYKRLLSISSLEPIGYFIPYRNNSFPLILRLSIVFLAGYLIPIGYNYISAVTSCFKELIVD